MKQTSKLIEEMESIIDRWWASTYEDQHLEERDHLLSILRYTVLRHFPLELN